MHHHAEEILHLAQGPSLGSGLSTISDNRSTCLGKKLRNMIHRRMGRCGSNRTAIHNNNR
jgi:hypothetical protein